MNKMMSEQFQTLQQKVNRILFAKNTPPKQDSESQKIEDCLMIVEEYIIKNNSMGNDTVSNEVLHLIKQATEESVILASLMLSKMIEKAQTSLINEFVTQLLKTIRCLRRKELVDFVAVLFSKLIEKFENGIIESIEKQARELMQDLFVKSPDALHRYADYVLLKEIMRKKHYLIWKEMKIIEARVIFEKIVAEDGDIERIAFDFINETMRFISTNVEKEEQRHFFSPLAIGLIGHSKEKKSTEFFALFCVTYTCIFRYLDKSLFIEGILAGVFETTIENIKQAFSLNNSRVNKFLCQMIPEMVSFNSALFREKKLVSGLLDIVYEQIDIKNPLQMSYYDELYGSVTSVMKLFPSEIIQANLKRFGDKIMDLFILNSDRLSKNGDLDIKNILEFLKLAFRSPADISSFNDAKLHRFVTVLLTHFFEMNSISILELLRQHSNASFVESLNQKLKKFIGMILQKDDAFFDDFNDYWRDTNSVGERDRGFEETNAQSQNNNSKEEVVERRNSVGIRQSSKRGNFSKFEKHYSSKLKKGSGLSPLAISEDGFVERTKSPSDAHLRFRNCQGENVLLSRLRRERTGGESFVVGEKDLDKKVLVALEALGRFEFKSKSTLKRKEFITNTVLEYLYSPSVDLRKCVTRIVFVLISDNDSSKHADVMLSDESIQNLIKTIISIAVGDPDDEVRVEVLTALNTRMKSTFFHYAVKEETLKNLITMASDQNYKIQKHSVLLLQKLIPIFPQLMFRFDLMVFQASSFLLTSKLNFGSKALNYIRMLSIISKEAQFLLKRRLPVLVPILISSLEYCVDPDFPVDLSERKVFAKPLLKCLSYMLEYQVDLSRKHFDHLARMLTTYLTNLSTELSSSIVKFLAVIIRNSGFQLMAIIKYDLMNVLLNLSDTTPNTKLRINVLKLLGTIGAVDPLILKKAQTNSERLNSGGVEGHEKSIKILSKLRKKQFRFERQLHNAGTQDLGELGKEFDLLAKTTKSNQKDFLVQQDVRSEAHSQFRLKTPSNVPISEQTKKPSIKKLSDINQNQIDLSSKVQNEENLHYFVIHSTLKVLLSKIEDSSDENLVMECLESIQQIILTLSYHIFQFGSYVFRSLKSAFKKTQIKPVKILIVENLKYFAKATISKLRMNPKLVSKLIKILILNLEDKDLQPDLFSICKLLVQNKSFFPHQFKDLILHFVTLLKRETKTEIVKEIFGFIIGLNHKDYFYLITPSILELLPRKDKERESPEIVTQTILYFKKIIKSKHFENLLGTIIRSFTSLLTDYSQYGDLVKSFLIEIFKTWGEKCLNYVFLMSPFLRDVEEFQKIIKTLNEKGYIEIEVRNWEDQKEESDPENDEDLNEGSLKIFAKRKLNFESFRILFVANNFNKSDFDWNDWLTKLKSELISQSPSTVLIACKNLKMKKPIMDELFRPAFLMFWSELTEHQKSQVSRSLDTIISSTSKIQFGFRKAVLEVLEFMSQKNDFGIPLNIAKLGEFAINCNSPATAIYFKELEFQKSPQNAFGSLLNLYCEFGYRYTAEGLVDYAKYELKMKIPEEIVHMNGKWDFLPSNPTNQEFENEHLHIFGNIRSSNWELVLQKIKEVSQNKEGKTLGNQLANYAALAAFHLSRWDELKKYQNETQTERDFYKAIVLGVENNFDSALDCLDEEWKNCEKMSQGLLNYHSNYKKMVKLQRLAETEQMLKMQRHFDSLSKNELHHYLIPQNEAEVERQNYRKHVLEVWEDKLFSMERDVNFWQGILATRNVTFAKREMLFSYLKLWNICYNTDNSQLFTKILTTLKKESELLEIQDPLLELAEIECNFKTGKLQQKQIIGKIEELFLKKTMPKQHWHMFYKKAGEWVLKTENVPDLKDEKTVKFFERFLGEIKDDSCLWHYFAIANYQIVKRTDKKDLETNPVLLKFLTNSFQGFANSLAYEPKFNAKYTMQDLLRFLELWYKFHDSKDQTVLDAIAKNIEKIPSQAWVLILRQILARLEQKSNFSESAKNLLVSLVEKYPQYLVFPLLLAKRSKHEKKFRMITRVLRKLEETNKTLVHEAGLFSEQLIRISMLLDEIWMSTINDLKSKVSTNIGEVVEGLNYLFDLTSTHKGRSSHSEVVFFQKFGSETSQAREYLDLYETTKNELFFLHAWSICFSISQELELVKKNESTDVLSLERLSPELHQWRDSQLCVPGTLNINPLKNSDVFITQVHHVLKLLRSKRRPRKVTLFGSDSKEYSFLLKGSEDLRLDERVMQLLNITNDLLKPILDVQNQSITITTFNVLPLSFDCGIISWLEGWDTVFETIKSHRLKIGVKVDCERDLWKDFNENYNVLSKMKKLEVFRFVCNITKAEDLKNIFWLRSASADAWLIMRNNYICSLAVMSIVGYILGLGDRHLMNIMLEKSSGKIVHIDFGECFDSEQQREKYPEKVPFRLTRMLVNAMEACGIEGTFKRVAEMVMSILRLNKDVYLAFFEEFTCDPLITWQKVQKKASVEFEDDLRLKNSLQEHDSSQLDSPDLKDPQELNKVDGFTNSLHNHDLMPSRSHNQFNDLVPDQNLNSRAILAMKSIENKLNGKDFDNTEIDYKTQVKKLISQATNSENISQAYTGWNPFW